MQPPDTDVLIVGAGVAGLTLGMMLGEKGYRVTILDQGNAIAPMYRPELIQPAGLPVLQILGVLESLQDSRPCRCQLFEFFRLGGQSLCRVDYSTLTHEYPYALIVFPHLTQTLLLQRLFDYPSVRVLWGCKLAELVRTPGRSPAVTFWKDGLLRSLSTSVVVGADGKFSRVRQEAGIPAIQTQYRDAFVTVTVPRPSSFGDGVRYYLGRRQILGMFPASPSQLCLLFMVPGEGFDRLKAHGLSALKAHIAAVADGAADLLSGVTGWDQVSYMSCWDVRPSTWVRDGVVLLGDAAHACHPHVAQGTTQAMLDAMALAPVLKGCLDDNQFSAERLSAYEKARRPTTEALQRIAHEYAWIWNTGNPLLTWLRNRAFREIGRRPHLLKKVVETEAGIRVAPLSIFERIQALGVWP